MQKKVRTTCDIIQYNILIVSKYCETTTHNLGLFKYVEHYYMYIAFDMTLFNYLIGTYRTP